MISKSSQYALRAVIYIASRYKGKDKIGIPEITDAIDAPGAFTAKVLQVLTQGGVVSAVRGPKGGFYLDANQMRQPIINIIKAVEGLELFTLCGLGLKDCSDKNPCPLHDTYQQVRTQLLKVFQKTTIEMLARNYHQGTTLMGTVPWKGK